MRWWPAFPFQTLVSHTRASRETLSRGYFHEEPYAGKPPVRICEGEAEWPSYSTTPVAPGRPFQAVSGRFRARGSDSVDAELRQRA